ncbi:MAG: CPBP family intramembrane glutamic endopeptidase [Actinomycetota bacterium]
MADNGAAGPGQLLWLFLPIGTAMLLRWRGGDGFGDAGLRPHYRQNSRWYDLSSALYPITMLTAIGGGIAVGHWELYDDWAPLRFAAVAAFALIPFTFAAIAEEFGWRGYLTPRLEAAGVGRLANHVLVGVVWGVWHLPYLAEAWDYSTESLWTLAPRVVLGTTVIAVVYGEIRLRTGTVWPAVVMHASSNAVAGALINTDNVLLQNEAAPWLFAPGVDGVVVIAISAVLAAVLMVRRPARLASVVADNRPGDPVDSAVPVDEAIDEP